MSHDWQQNIQTIQLLSIWIKMVITKLYTFPGVLSSESIIIFLPSKRTITGAGLTLTLASLIPCSRNLIPKGDIKVIINGHGDSKGIGDRSIEEIAEHISIIDRATGEDSGVRKVSLVYCHKCVLFLVFHYPQLR
jgi:hypothetical protein